MGRVPRSQQEGFAVEHEMLRYGRDLGAELMKTKILNHLAKAMDEEPPEGVDRGQWAIAINRLYRSVNQLGGLEPRVAARA